MRYMVLASVLWIVARVILRRKDFGWPSIIVAIMLLLAGLWFSIYWWMNYVIWEW
jgi:hypothetical protein